MHLRVHECCGSLPRHHHLERVSIPGCHAGCRGRKRWILSVPVKGSLRMDAGAARAVEQRSKSLFSAGIGAVSGDFSAQDAVALCDAAGRELGRGLCNYSAAEVDKIKVCAVVHLDRACARLVAPQAKVFSFDTEMTSVALACGCPLLLGLSVQSVAPAFFMQHSTQGGAEFPLVEDSYGEPAEELVTVEHCSGVCPWLSMSSHGDVLRSAVKNNMPTSADKLPKLLRAVRVIMLAVCRAWLPRTL